MKSIFIVFVAKIFSLFGAILNTVGFATFFIWESLANYRWEMILGGLALIAISEGIAYFLTKKIADEDLEPNDDIEM